MSEQRKRVSLVIPVYNAEKYIKPCMENVMEQTISKDELEVILIDDGSTDSTPELCREYAEKYPFVRTVSVANGGCAQARNVALDLVTGKYIAYLDCDDKLTNNTLKDIADFFDKHYDETDLVTYRVVNVENGARKKLHYRYGILKNTGIYDLNDPDNIYISQTHINIVVKNLGDENVLFDTTHNYRHEDQLYCTEVLRRKMTIGFVSGCEYLYENNAFGIVNSFYSSELFDVTMKKWEELFESFGEKVPQYIQALYFNDLQWKMKENILLPRQLEGKAYNMSVDRIRQLLLRVDDRLIIEHPGCAEMNKFFFLDLKYGGEITFAYEDKMLLKHGEKTVYQADTVKIVIDRFKLHGDRAEVCGHLSSPVFKYSEKPELSLRGRYSSEPLELFESSFCFDCADEKNNQAWGFRFELDTSRDITAAFMLTVGGRGCDTEIVSGEWVPVKPEIGRSTVTMGTKQCQFTEKRIVIKNVDAKAEKKYRFKTALGFIKKNFKVFLVRMLNLIMPKKRIWLYQDSGTVEKDNGYYQFIHDFYKDDGVTRYYVVEGAPEKYRSLFDEKQMKNVISLRSNRHKLLYLGAEKIITAFIETTNYVPFFSDVYKYYCDLFTGEVVYLQHGVLHAHMPWKYAYERLDVDRVVISTAFEEKNFTENYHFPESALIKSGMPRYDVASDAEPKDNRILYAPSWRKYLIGHNGSGKWTPTPEKFMRSEYFRSVSEFLASDELQQLLEENGWYLDVKLHPVFKSYKDCFKVTAARVGFVDSAEPADYKVCLTDYSSFVFDFVRLNRAVAYYVPDYKEFRAGMNDYRALDLPLEDGFGELAQNGEDALKALKRIMENDGKILPPFTEKYSDFFLADKNCMDGIYKAVSEN